MMNIKINKDGRILLPKIIRQALGITENDRNLTIEIIGKKIVIEKEGK